ncbi:ATP-binding protein [Streptomyces niger]|uniref:ATP-binding protein n=1 Tax=Streptomyces niger TaxID=66373 RepID=UPI001F43A68E|nr:ATP-binding protein [Streptomyces niger]
MPSSHNAATLRGCGGVAVELLSDAFQLPALRTSVPEARRRVTAALREWGAVEQVRDDAELVVSELFTNAVRHTDSEQVHCELTLDGARLRVAVTDQGHSDSRPRAQPRSTDRECGRGLLLVGALSEDWGERPADTGRGRVVWADLAY